MIIKTLSGELYNIDYRDFADFYSFQELGEKISELSPDFHPEFIMLTRENGESFHPWGCTHVDDVPDLENDETLMLMMTTDVYTFNTIDWDQRSLVCRFQSMIETEVDSGLNEFEVKWSEEDDLDTVCLKIEEGVDETCNYPPVQRQNVIDEICEYVRNYWDH